ILAEEQLVLEYVTNQSTQEKNVRASPKRYPDIRHGRRSAEAWVHMQDLRATLLGLHDPLKSDRMVLRHIRSHDQDRVGVEQIIRCCCCSAASVSCAQTGHRRAMSYTGLIA